MGWVKLWVDRRYGAYLLVLFLLLFLSSVEAVVGGFVWVAHAEEVIFTVVSLEESGSMWGGTQGILV